MRSRLLNSKHQDFLAFINAFKAVSPTISEAQRKGLLRRGVEEHGLSVDEAVEILDTSGLVIGEQVNYLEVLGLSISDIENQAEDEIVHKINAAHKNRYRASLNAGGRPRADGKTEEQWRMLLNQAHEVLLDPERRDEHIAVFQYEVVEQYSDIERTSRQQTTHQTVSHDVPNDMVYIPAGEFLMGSDAKEAKNSEKPVHNVYTDAFFMDKYLVTNAQFKAFIDANPQWQVPRWLRNTLFLKYRDQDYLKDWYTSNYPNGKANHPVKWVSWYAAMAYAQWVGKRLPTEAEWEKAARCGVSGQKYPWGNTIHVSSANYDKHVGETTPIDAYPPNKNGLYDMVGNVAEWCLDEWDSEFYVSSQSRNPIAGGSISDIIENLRKTRKSRVIRGGSWYSSVPEVSVSSRDRLDPWKTASTTGFRCVKPIES